MKIKILVKEPNKEMYGKTIETIGDIYGLVYYPYKNIRILNNVYLIYSGNIVGNDITFLKPNIRIDDFCILGTCIIVARKKDKLNSLTPREIEEIKSGNWFNFNVDFSKKKSRKIFKQLQLKKIVNNMVKEY